MIKFFVSQANRGYLNGLATEMGESTNSIRKELNHLQGAGYLQKVKVDREVDIKKPIEHPHTKCLLKVVGYFRALRMKPSLTYLQGDVEVVLGDYAKGKR